MRQAVKVTEKIAGVVGAEGQALDSAVTAIAVAAPRFTSKKPGHLPVGERETSTRRPAWCR
jgi:hypothetical protein